MGQSNQFDEINSPNEMRRLQKEAEQRRKDGKAGIKAEPDPGLQEITEGFEKDSKAEIKTLFFSEKLDPFEYCLLNLLSDLARKKKK